MTTTTTMSLLCVTREPTNQPTSRPIDRPTDQPADQPTDDGRRNKSFAETRVFLNYFFFGLHSRDGSTKLTDRPTIRPTHPLIDRPTDRPSNRWWKMQQILCRYSRFFLIIFFWFSFSRWIDEIDQSTNQPTNPLIDLPTDQSTNGRCNKSFADTCVFFFRFFFVFILCLPTRHIFFRSFYR